jgi:MtN3 and saliva related transmembrane protein
MLIAKIFGLLGGAGTTISFIPQVYKIYNSKSNEGVSLFMLAIHCSGVTSWIIYGILIDNSIVLAYNSITLILLIMLIIKYVYNYFYN